MTETDAELDVTYEQAVTDVTSSVSTRTAHERVEAARALLGNAILTATSHPEQLSMVRLHAAALRSMFATQLGYQLILEANFARLVKAPLAAAAPARALRRADGSDFTPIMYTHLALLCAALLSRETGEQILISALIDLVRSDAAILDIDIGDTLPERRALVHALSRLIDWGLVIETDGTAAGWGERRDEALLTVNRTMLPHLLMRPLSELRNVEQLLDPGADSIAQPRRSLRRKLVENPLVRREDLTDAERDVLSRERSEITRLLEENFGLHVEVRAEGALAYDTTSALTDIAFPGVGAVKQAALLLISALADTLQAEGGVTALTDDGRTVPGQAASFEQVDIVLSDLIARHGKAWGAIAATGPVRLRDEVISLLVDLSLAVRTTTGIILHPASRRYLPEPNEAGPSRAVRRRVAAGSPADRPPDAQLPFEEIS